MYSILTKKKAKRQFRLNKAAATEIVQRAVINRSLYFLKLFKETLDKFYDGKNWAIRTIHGKGCDISFDSGDSCNCTPLEEYTWVGENPRDLINEVFIKWEERNGSIWAAKESGENLQEESKAGNNIRAQLPASGASKEGVVGVVTTNELVDT